jgi:hypothetical protein
MFHGREVESPTPLLGRLLRIGRAPAVIAVLLGVGGMVALPANVGASSGVAEKAWLQKACPEVVSFGNYVNKTLDTGLENATKAKSVSAARSAVVRALQGFDTQLATTGNQLKAIGTPATSQGQKFATATEGALSDLENSMKSAITKIQKIKASSVSSFATKAQKDFSAAETSAEKKVGNSTKDAAAGSVKAAAKKVPSCTPAGLS